MRKITLFFFVFFSVFFPSYFLKAASLPQAKMMIQSHRDILKMNPGEIVEFQVGFKNTGKDTWLSTGDNALALRSLGPSPFQHSSWVNKTEPTKMDIKSAKPGEIAFFRWTLQAPTTPGIYKEEYQLVSGDALWIQNGRMTLPVEVISSNGSEVVVLSSETDSQTPSTFTPILQIPEPNIRVGLYSTSEPVMIQATTPYEIRDLKNNLLFQPNTGQTSTVDFDPQNQSYTVELAGEKKVVTEGVRFRGLTETPLFEIKNFENRPSWNLSLNDNVFYGTLELRYNTKKNRSWVINELPLEKYLEGIGESSNSSPIEFQKALALASRTYAMFHFLNPKKHADEYFTVDATNDQIYRGYNLSQRLTKFVEAVKATRGQVVTYDNEVVITPFFSQSDGHTRAWEEVWGGGAKPWLVSVDDPWNKGKALLGHGVGLSAQGAIGLAQENRFTFDQIVKHYYTGVTIQKVY